MPNQDDVKKTGNSSGPDFPPVFELLLRHRIIFFVVSGLVFVGIAFANFSRPTLWEARSVVQIGTLIRANEIVGRPNSYPISSALRVAEEILLEASDAGRLPSGFRLVSATPLYSRDEPGHLRVEVIAQGDSAASVQQGIETLLAPILERHRKVVQVTKGSIAQMLERLRKRLDRVRKDLDSPSASSAKAQDLMALSLMERDETFWATADSSSMISDSRLVDRNVYSLKASGRRMAMNLLMGLGFSVLAGLFAAFLADSMGRMTAILKRSSVGS